MCIYIYIYGLPWPNRRASSLSKFDPGGCRVRTLWNPIRPTGCLWCHRGELSTSHRDSYLYFQERYFHGFVLKHLNITANIIYNKTLSENGVPEHQGKRPSTQQAIGANEATAVQTSS